MKRRGKAIVKSSAGFAWALVLSLPCMSAVVPEEMDRILGAVLEYADGSFNTILELGFASSIRKEWDWRISRGESTRNLEAFIGPLGLDRPSE